MIADLQQDSPSLHRAGSAPAAVPMHDTARGAFGVHRLFEAQAQRAPDAVALCCRDQHWTYRALDGRAGALARALKDQGVGPGDLVGICAERSTALGAAVLAVLKSGAAYVPLDPALPEQRLRLMLDDCRPAAVLADRAARAHARAWRTAVLPIELCTDDVPAGERPSFRPDDRDDQLAYVIYTSGTTGTPKGVMIEHGPLFNHCRAVARLYQLAPTDRVLQFASLNFDVAAEEMFPTWASGATVVMWPFASGLAPIRNFVHFIDASRITVLNLPAPYWHEWVEEIDRVGVPASVRLVVVGSDVVLGEKAAAWQNYTGGRVRLVNAYGLSEATITAATYEVPRAPEARGAVPIGRPIANVTAYVLDEQRRPVPPRRAGELYLGGVCLARGYLHRPDQDQAKFCPDPFAPAPGARIYRTGDQVRRLADGNLQFLGRRDDQIKVRGFRVEIGEIEALLRCHPRIRSVAVIARPDAAANTRLAAYVVGRDGPPPARELRSYLRAHLPEYMVPQLFVALRRLPVTAGGKLDRGRLALLRSSRSNLESDYLAPRGELEAMLARIWETELETAPIGVREDFFELGGNSLLLVRVAAQIEQRLNINLALSALLQARTIETLARLVASKRQARPGALICPGRVQGARAPLFCHGGSDGLARLLGADQPVYWLDPHGMNGGHIPNTVEEMAAEYLDELSLIQPRGPYFLLGYSFGGLVMIELARLLIARSEEVALLVLVDPSAPPDLEAAPALPGQRRIVATQAHAARLRRWRRALLDCFCRTTLALGGRVPPWLRLFHFAQGSDRALQRYRAKVYPGSFVLFRRPDNLTEEQWRGLALGAVEHHESWIDHNDFLEPPCVHQICRQIERQLEKLRTTGAGAQTKSAPQP